MMFSDIILGSQGAQQKSGLARCVPRLYVFTNLLRPRRPQVVTRSEEMFCDVRGIIVII